MSFPVFGSWYSRMLFLLPFTTEFNYDNPQKWEAEFTKCRGFRQSPIALNALKALPAKLPPIGFELYNVPLREKLILRNNGHTIEFKVPETVLHERPYIKGGLLKSIYLAEQVHFHWGSMRHRGSEHIVNGHRYDLEMHMVHRNVRYPDAQEAQKHSDGLAVLGVLFKVVKSPNVYYPELNEIYNALDKVVEFNRSTSMESIIRLDSLLATINTEEFFAYEGSLTTPPCSEAVTWHVFPDVIPISYNELPKFWKFRDVRGHPLRKNFRPLQHIADRHIYYRIPALDIDNDVANDFLQFL